MDAQHNANAAPQPSEQIEEESQDFKSSFCEFCNKRVKCRNFEDLESRKKDKNEIKVTLCRGQRHLSEGGGKSDGTRWQQREPILTATDNQENQNKQNSLCRLFRTQLWRSCLFKWILMWDAKSHVMWERSKKINLMMIAFIAIKSGFVPLIEGLCAQILYFRFQIIGGLRSRLLLFFSKEKVC